MEWWGWVFVAFVFVGWLSLAASVTIGKEKSNGDK